MSSNSQPASPSTPILRAAPVGTVKVIPPSAERQASSPIRGYAQPQGSTTKSTSHRATTTADEASPTAVKKNAGGSKRKKRRAAKVSIDFSVRAPSDEELYDGSMEVPGAVEDAAKEEKLGREFDSDGVEARLGGLKIDVSRPVGHRSEQYLAKPGESEYVDDPAIQGKK